MDEIGRRSTSASFTILFINCGAIRVLKYSVCCGSGMVQRYTWCYNVVNNYIRPTVNYLEGSLYLHRTDHCFLVAVQKM